MKTILFIVLAVGLLVTPAYALLDSYVDESNTNQQAQGIFGSGNSDNINRNVNQQGQQQGIDSDIRNTNMNSDFNSQGQLQGQGQIGKVETTVDGDNIESYVLAAPSTVAGEGQRATAAYSIFGGINFTQTEEAKQCADNINLLILMAANDIISKEELRTLAIEQYAQLTDASQPKRVLGILWKTRGNHLFNGFGALACDDLLSRLSLPVVKERTEDVELTGNLGNVNE